MAVGLGDLVAVAWEEAHAEHVCSANARALREQEAAQAMETLGILAANLRFLGFPDGGINPALLDQVGVVTSALRELRPQLLYLPHPDDASFDHRAAFTLCWRAAGMAGSRNFPEWGSSPHWVPVVLGYEVWSPIREPAYSRRLARQIASRLTAAEFILPGTLTERMTRCGRANCRCCGHSRYKIADSCHADPPQLHGPYHQWTRKIGRKTVTRILTDDQLADYQPWFDTQRTIRALITELETLSQQIADNDPRWKR